MRDGVRASRVFLLVLSASVLGRWFCRQEMRAAIEARKPVQLVLEEEDRFAPFDLAEWGAPSRDSRPWILPRGSDLLSFTTH
jgi:hypothetical protein